MGYILVAGLMTFAFGLAFGNAIVAVLAIAAIALIGIFSLFPN